MAVSVPCLEDVMAGASGRPSCIEDVLFLAIVRRVRYDIPKRGVRDWGSVGNLHRLRRSRHEMGSAPAAVA